MARTGEQLTAYYENANGSIGYHVYNMHDLVPEQAIAATLGDYRLAFLEGKVNLQGDYIDKLTKEKNALFTQNCEAATRHAGQMDAMQRKLEAATLGNEINGETSDGYHTFNELYHHRAVLFSVIVRDHRELAWKARKHHDGTMYDGMFIVGIETPKGQATYHYDLDPYWEMFDCEEREFAPEWDGHTPDEAIARIAELGSRTLTAEQVMAIAAKHQPDYCSDTHVCFDWQAIADDLNAERHVETCRSTTPDNAWCFSCSSCGRSFPRNELLKAHNYGEINYCPNCGAKVIQGVDNAD